MFARAACVALQKLVPSKHNNSGSSSSLSTTEQLRQSGLDKATLSTILSKLETLLLDVPAFVEQEPAAEGSDNEEEGSENKNRFYKKKEKCFIQNQQWFCAAQAAIDTVFCLDAKPHLILERIIQTLSVRTGLLTPPSASRANMNVSTASCDVSSGDLRDSVHSHNNSSFNEAEVKRGQSYGCADSMARCLFVVGHTALKMVHIHSYMHIAT